MQKVSTEVPIVGEELERKFWESVEWLEKNKDKGVISDREYILCIITLFKCTCGLVSDQASEAIDLTIPDNIMRRLK